MPGHLLQGLQPRAVALLEGALEGALLVGHLRLRCAPPAHVTISFNAMTHLDRGSTAMNTVDLDSSGLAGSQLYLMAL